MDTKQFIGQLSDEELRLYIVAFVEGDKEAGNKLCDFIKRQINAVGINNAEASVEKSFKAIRNAGDHWHPHWICDWDSIYRESYTLCDRARNAIATGNPDTALAIGTRWLECFANTYDDGEAYYFDDEGVYLGEACQKAMDVINEALTHPNASDNMKKDTVKRLQDLDDRRDSPFDDYFSLGFSGFVTHVSAFTLSDEDALAYLDDLLVKDFDNGDLLLQKHKLLLKMGRHQDAESILEENIDNQTVASYYVNLLLDDNQYAKLIPILKDLTDPEYETRNLHTHHWLETLATCQESMGLKDDATDTYRRIFIHTKGDLKYYLTLKQRVAQEDWSQYLDKLLEEAHLSESYCLSRCNYADILVEEGRFQELHDWLKTKSEDSLSYYLPKLPQELRADLFPIYRKQILDYACRAKKRDSYAHVCDHIAIIKALPEGEPIAKEIAAIFKDKYGSRPAFMDELRKVMAK